VGNYESHEYKIVIQRTGCYEDLKWRERNKFSSEEDINGMNSADWRSILDRPQFIGELFNVRSDRVRVSTRVSDHYVDHAYTCV